MRANGYVYLTSSNPKTTITMRHCPASQASKGHLPQSKTNAAGSWMTIPVSLNICAFNSLISPLVASMLFHFPSPWLHIKFIWLLNYLDYGRTWWLFISSNTIIGFWTRYAALLYFIPIILASTHTTITLPLVLFSGIWHVVMSASSGCCWPSSVLSQTDGIEFRHNIEKIFLSQPNLTHLWRHWCGDANYSGELFCIKLGNHRHLFSM